MTTYSIKINYTTGNSLGSERTTEEVGMNWTDIDQAKKALRYIKEHYEAYKECEESNSSAWHRAHGPFDIDSVREKPWYHGPIDVSFPDAWQSTVVIDKDDGSRFAIDAFWIGHFETLHMAEVCIASSDTESNDMRIYF